VNEDVLRNKIAEEEEKDGLEEVEESDCQFSRAEGMTSISLDSHGKLSDLGTPLVQLLQALRP
jgi:hypothetical protein